MKVLVACEESQRVCIAFRERGHEAYSCDIIDCSGGHPEWHIKDDVLNVLNNNWNLIIAHPPCTYLSSAGLHWMKVYPKRKEELLKAFDFVKAIWNAPAERICIENPVGWLNTNWKPATQIIEPFYYGDNHRKRTCLWLKNLPKLQGRIEVARDIKKFTPEPISYDKNGRSLYYTNFLSSKRKKERSKTFHGIAAAMAEQWGKF